MGGRYLGVATYVEMIMVCIRVSFSGEVILHEVDDDRLIWKRDTTSAYSVKETYKLLIPTCRVVSVSFSHTWGTKLPQTVFVFLWHLLRGRLPSKLNLSRRNILSHGTNLLCLINVIFKLFLRLKC